MSGPEHLPLLLRSFPHPLPPLPPLPLLPISLAAEIIQKECLALVEQMIGGAKERERKRRKVREIVFCGAVKAFLFCFPWKP